MIGSQVLRLIDDIAATSSKNEKTVMVTKGMTDVLFKEVCERAYNPFKTYGIQKIPERVSDGREQELCEDAFEILDALVSRSLTGNAARDAVQNYLNFLNAESAELFTRILRKDLRAGFSESTINKACKGLIPEFPYMRCALPKDTSLAKWPWAEGVFSQEKADGMFANVDHEEGGLVRIASRQGSEFPIEKFAEMANDVRSRLTAGYQNHGEIVVYRDGVVCERQDGNGVLNSVLSGGDFAANEKPVYLVWDQIPLMSVMSKGKCSDPYRNRITSVIRQLHAVSGESVRLIPTKILKSLPEAMAHYRTLLAEGKEGTVIKHPKAIWKDGTSKEQIKLKLEVDVDLKVVSIVPGKEGGRNEGRAGSLTCVSVEGLLQVDVTVKNEAMRDYIDKSPEDWIGQVIVVRANSIMYPSASNEAHSLFLPRMVETSYRTDKTDPDSLQRVIDQFNSAVAA